MHFWRFFCRILPCMFRTNNVKLVVFMLLTWLSVQLTIPVRNNLILLNDRSYISPWIKSISNVLDINCHVFASQLFGHCDVIANRLWRHQQTVKRASESREWYVNILVITLSWAHKQSTTRVHTLLYISFPYYSVFISAKYYIKDGYRV